MLLPTTKPNQTYLEKHTGTQLKLIRFQLIRHMYSGSLYHMFFKDKNHQEYYRRINSNSFYTQYKKVETK